MNAMIREKYEAPVLTNEAIEVHLSYLRAGFDAIQAALPALRDKIDALNEKTNCRIDALSSKVDELNEKTNSRIDALDEKLEASNARLGAKIDQLTEKVLEDRAQLKSIILLFGSISVIASLASVGRTLGWI